MNEKEESCLFLIFDVRLLPVTKFSIISISAVKKKNVFVNMHCPTVQFAITIVQL